MTSFMSCSTSTTVVPRSAIAAISGASPNGFTVSGTWRQQFDWCVIEWNRDNGFEHPALRYLPDEDLSGLVLTYEEERTNCIPLDSDLYPAVEWHALRIWDAAQPHADPYLVCLREHATPVAGAYQDAYAEFSLSGTVTAGDWVGIEALGQRYHAALEGFARVGEAEVSPFGVQRLGNPPGNRIFIGDAEDQRRLAVHKTHVYRLLW